VLFSRCGQCPLGKGGGALFRQKKRNIPGGRGTLFGGGRFPFQTHLRTEEGAEPRREDGAGEGARGRSVRRGAVRAPRRPAGWNVWGDVSTQGHCYGSISKFGLGLVVGFHLGVFV